MANENEDDGVEVVKFIPGCKNITWPPNVESYLIGLIEEEVKKGSKQNNTLTQAAWWHIKEELKREFGREYTPYHLKYKFSQLRGRWKDFSSLLKMEIGLAYNSITGQIIVTNDQWKKLCEKYKFAKKGCMHYEKLCFILSKGCMHYDKLCFIFGDTTTSRANMYPSTKTPSMSDGDDSEGDNNFDQEEDSYQSKEKASINKDIKKRKARETDQEAFVNALTTFGEIATKKLEILEKRSPSHVIVSSTNAIEEVVGQSKMQDKESLMTCLRVLQELEGIDGASFAKTVKLLKEDPLWRDVFLSLSNKRKKDLVLNL